MFEHGALEEGASVCVCVCAQPSPPAHYVMDEAGAPLEREREKCVLQGEVQTEMAVNIWN